MSAGELLILDRVAVGYPDRLILSEVTLRLQRECFTALLGANGSGKSSLLRTILGLLPPLGGTMSWLPIDGRNPRLGYVPQRDSLDPLFLFTSLEVVMQACCIRLGPGRFPGRAEKDWARECLRRTGSGDLERVPFSILSGGQKQRVLIARALAVRPDLLLLDEPTSGIDPAATQAVLSLLHRLNAEDRMGVVLITHELSPLRGLARDVIWLRQGRAVQGPVGQLLTQEKIDEMYLV